MVAVVEDSGALIYDWVRYQKGLAARASYPELVSV